MERRTFLKLAGLGATAAAMPATAIAALVRQAGPAAPASRVQPAQPVQPAYTAAIGSTMYRGQGGLVLVSTDSGQTWARHSNLGPDVAVAALGVVGRTVRMTMRLGTRELRLVLADDGRFWRTA
jgi:hypothetical protein